MKLQIFVIVIVTLVTPMIIIAQSEEKMFGKYPYCTECKYNYKDDDGDWFYSHSKESWCKVDEKKCQEISCGPVRGFSCCNDTSIKVSYSDTDGEWGVENKKWCLIEPSEFDIDMSLYAWHDENPLSPDYGAMFSFKLIDISNADFMKKYDTVYAELNGNQVDPYFDPIGIRFETYTYDRNNNNITLIFREKKTNKRYFKKFLNVALDITW